MTIAELGRGRGAPKKIDIALMAVFALLVVRLHGAHRKPATRAAILAYFTWIDDERPDRYVAIHEGAVLKALQRLESGRTTVHPLLSKAAGFYDPATGKPFFGTAPEIAQSVAKFLPH